MSLGRKSNHNQDKKWFLNHVYHVTNIGWWWCGGGGGIIKSLLNVPLASPL